MRMYMNNKYSRQVRVFSKVKVSFSVGGTYYDERSSYTWPHTSDLLREYARYVVIPMNNHIGQYVKVQMYFDAEWIMLSEVEFQSGNDAKVT